MCRGTGSMYRGQEVCVGAALDDSQEDTIHRHIDAEFALLAVEWFCVGLFICFCNSQGPRSTFCGQSTTMEKGSFK